MACSDARGTSAEMWLSYRYTVLVQVFVRWCRLLFFLISAPGRRDDIDSGSGQLTPFVLECVLALSIELGRKVHARSARPNENILPKFRGCVFYSLFQEAGYLSDTFHKADATRRTESS